MRVRFGLRRLVVGTILLSASLAVSIPYGQITSTCGLIAGVGLLSLALILNRSHIPYFQRVFLISFLFGFIGSFISAAISPSGSIGLIIFLALGIYVGMINARIRGLHKQWRPNLTNLADAND